MVEFLRVAYDVSERHACRAIRVPRSSHRYRSIKNPDTPLRMRLRELAATRIRYGYRRMYIVLRREGWRVNHKRVYRLYCEEGLHLRAKRPKRRRMAAHRANRPEATSMNESWSMDFVSDGLFNGRRFRSLTVVDNFSRECLGIWVDQSIKGDDVVGFMQRLAMKRGAPARVFLDNVLSLEVKIPLWTDLSCAIEPRRPTLSLSAPRAFHFEKEVLFTIVIQGPWLGLDRTQHNTQPPWKLRALSTRSGPASMARANGVLHGVGLAQSRADSPYWF